MIKGIPGTQDLLNFGKIMSSTIKTSQGRKLYGSTNWHRNCFLKWSETMWVPGHRNFLCLLFLVYGEQASASMTFRASLVAQMVKKKICLQCRRLGFNPWVGKIPWRRDWQPILVFLPREFHVKRSLAGYSPWGHKESDTTEWLTLSLSMTFPEFQGAVQTVANQGRENMQRQGRARQETIHSLGAGFWFCLKIFELQ